MRPTVALFIVTGIVSLALYAQSPVFEVATIRLNNDGPQMSSGPGLRNGTLRTINVPLRRILATAWGMMEPRVIGPDWLDQKRFDITAKSPQGVADTELKPMLQALLKDRFKLTTHLEKKEMAVYDLVVAKGGVKMAIYPAPAHPPDDPNIRAGAQMRGMTTTAQLADNLTSFVDRPVIDKTGLTERYDYLLQFTPLSSRPPDTTAELTAPDLFTAIQQQLGLKLEPAKDNLDVVVIDHMEQLPTDN